MVSAIGGVGDPQGGRADTLGVENPRFDGRLRTTASLVSGLSRFALNQNRDLHPE
jgi:hypothetical protein